MLEKFSKALTEWLKENGLFDPLVTWLGKVDPKMYWSAVALLTILILLLIRRSIVSQSYSSGVSFSGTNEKVDRLEALVQDLRSQNAETLHKLRGEILFLRQELEQLRHGASFDRNKEE